MTIPFKISGIDHVVLRARDIGGMIRFYTHVLGCTLEREQPEIGLHQLRAGRSLIDLVAVEGVLGRRGGIPPSLEGHNLDHLAIGIEPFEEPSLKSHLLGHGVEVQDEGSRYGAGGEGPAIYIKDPEGNTVELKGNAN